MKRTLYAIFNLTSSSKLNNAKRGVNPKILERRLVVRVLKYAITA